MASGGGSTFRFLTEEFQAGRIPGEMKLLIVDSPRVGAIAHAQELGVPYAIVDRESYRREGRIDQGAFYDEIIRHQIRHDITVVLQNGWAWKTDPKVAEREGVVLSANQHAGNPDKKQFGGKGMGTSDIVQTALLNFFERVDRDGHTVVVAQRLGRGLDEGPVLEYEEIPVTRDMTVERLKKALLPYEWEAQKRMIIAFAEGTLQERVPPPTVLPGEEEHARLAREDAIAQWKGKTH